MHLMTLEQYLTNEKLTDAEFGIRVGLSQSQISRIRRGISLPSWDAMERIEEGTSGAVTANDFRRKAREEESVQ
jgi:transcriptional regulator with XRE-family HTH domain